MIQTRYMLGLAATVATIFFAVIPETYAQSPSQSAIVTTNSVPTAEQIQSLMARAVENQHRDDHALEEFARVEHIVARKAENAEILSDRTDRIVPSGTGTMKLQLAENGTPVTPEALRHELEYAIGALDLALHPTERYKLDRTKFERRQREHAEFVDTAAKAFRMTWAGRETRADSMGNHAPRLLAKFLLEPDPNYKPTNRLAAIFEHVHATLWIDEAQAQFARLEGDIASDVTFGGGIVGKVNHGGHFMMEQSEVSPRVWLPTLYTYDLDGRKFLFGFSVHERTEITQYRHVGSPAQSIEIIRSELSNLNTEKPMN